MLSRKSHGIIGKIQVKEEARKIQTQIGKSNLRRENPCWVGKNHSIIGKIKEEKTYVEVRKFKLRQATPPPSVGGKTPNEGVKTNVEVETFYIIEKPPVRDKIEFGLENPKTKLEKLKLKCEEPMLRWKLKIESGETRSEG